VNFTSTSAGLAQGSNYGQELSALAEASNVWFKVHERLDTMSKTLIKVGLSYVS
jgi:hypothetical protein